MIRVAIRTTQREELVCVTDRVQAAVQSAGVEDGLCLVFCPHTTAGITVNEAADPEVPSDLLSALSRLVPDDGPWRHREGNSPAHVKASLVGCSVLLTIKDGSLELGTWQGVFLCEFDGPRFREILVQSMG